MTSTTGVVRETVRFSASIVSGLLAALLLHAFTLAYLGHLGGSALYVRAIYTPIGFLVLAVTEGLVVASQVSAGIATRHRRRDLLRPLPTHTVLGAGALLLIAALFAAGRDMVFGLFEVGRADRDGVVPFVVAMCLSSAAGLVPAIAGAVLRGIGRAGASSLLSVGSALLAAVATVGLGATTGLGALAVPAGLLIAAIAAGAGGALLLREHLPGIPGPRLRRDAVGELWAFGLPVAATFLLLSFVSTGFLRVLRNAGTTEIAGFALGQNANTFFMVAALAIGSGAAIAANLRPGEQRRPIVEAGMTAAIRTALPVYAVVGLLAYVLRHPIAHLLTSDDAVAAVSADYFTWMGPAFVVFGATLALLTYLEQVGRAAAALALNAVYFAVLLAIAFLLPQPVDSRQLTQLLAAGNVVGFATCWLSARHLIRRIGPEDR